MLTSDEYRNLKRHIYSKVGYVLGAIWTMTMYNKKGLISNSKSRFSRLKNFTKRTKESPATFGTAA